MLNPIKRVWVPRNAEAPVADIPAQAALAPTAAPPSPAPPPLPASAVPLPPAAAAAPLRRSLFDELPEPEVEERNSDSVWAEFDSVFNTAPPAHKGS